MHILSLDKRQTGTCIYVLCWLCNVDAPTVSTLQNFNINALWETPNAEEPNSQLSWNGHHFPSNCRSRRILSCRGQSEQQAFHLEKPGPNAAWILDEKNIPSTLAREAPPLRRAHMNKLLRTADLGRSNLGQKRPS